MNEGAQTQKKKGLSPLAWIAIGCGGIVLLGILAVGVGGFFVAKKGGELLGELQDNPTKKVAEMAIKMSPDVEFIESDDETVTFRTEEGEVVTMNFEDIQNGKFSYETEGGESSTFTLSEDGITATGADGESQQANFNVFSGGDTDPSSLPDEIRFPDGEDFGSTFTSSGDSGASGMINYLTDASKEEVIAWHRENLGESCTVNEVSIAGSQHASLDCGANSATLTFMREDGRLKVVTNYNIKN